MTIGEVEVEAMLECADLPHKPEEQVQRPSRHVRILI
jgi:hypothetical protein